MTEAAPLFSQDATPEGVAYLVVDLYQKTIFFKKNKHDKQSQHIYVPIDNRLSSLALFRLQNYVHFFFMISKKIYFFRIIQLLNLPKKGKQSSSQLAKHAQNFPLRKKIWMKLYRRMKRFACCP